jgi:hypothetical protein
LDAEDTRYGDSFLFTEQEVQEFLQKTEVSIGSFCYATLSKWLRLQSSLQLTDLKEYYNSYWARGYDGTSISLFNPWSVHQAIAEGQLSCYWNQTSSYNPIHKAIWSRGPDFTNRLIKLLAGERVTLPTRDIVTYEESVSICFVHHVDG